MLVGVLQKDADLAPLRDKGFDAQNLTGVIALCDTADEKFDSRQQAMAAQLTQTNELNRLFDKAVKQYADFRETARTVLSDEGPLKALKVSDAVPDALENFLTDARSAYTTAKKKAYVTALGKKGYDAAALDEQLAALEALREADEEQARLTGDAKKATTERRQAVAPIQKFRSDVRRVARRVFRKQPEQLAKLDF